MRLLVLFTGGTIGSAVSGRIIGPDTRAPRLLLALYRTAYGDGVTFETEEPYNILSENLSRGRWPVLAARIRARAGEGFDGVIVTHGTDTLPFTAAALAYLLPGLTVPVLLVSADRVPDDPASNALANFAAAVAFAATHPAGGVYVPYRNRGDDRVLIHYGSRLLPHPVLDDTVTALGGPCAAVGPDGTVQRIGALLPPDEVPPLPPTLPPLTARLLCLSAYVDMGAALEMLPVQGLDGVLFTPYHSGTLPTACPAFAAFCRELHRCAVPVYVVCDDQAEHYASSERFDELHLHPLPGLSPTAAQVKFTLLHAAGRIADMPRRLAGDRL